MNGGAAEFERLARALAYERAIAIPVIRELLGMPSIPSRVHSQAWISAGMVFELADAVREAANETPERRGQLAHLATVIAAALDDTYPAITRAQCTAAAWKEVANVRRYQNQYEAALEALDIADRALGDQLVVAHDKAVLALVRATVYSDLRRRPEARRLLNDARPVFEAHGDQRRIGSCELLEGMIHHRDGNLPEAIAAYQRALPAATAVQDMHTLAMAHMNIGVAEADRGGTVAAMHALHRAVAILKDLGSRVEIARANWGVALALLTAGKYEAAIPIFRSARANFLALGLAEEAGLAGVELAEAYLGVERRAAASRLIFVVVDEFRQAKLNERALEALTYLRELGVEASPKAVQHVYSYLVRLRAEPNLLFRRLDE